MSYQFNRQQILQKTKKNYSKEKAAEYYLLNKQAIKKRQKTDTKMADKEKQAKKGISKKVLQEIKGL